MIKKNLNVTIYEHFNFIINENLNCIIKHNLGFMMNENFIDSENILKLKKPFSVI